jgi:hypothetical protein
MKNTIIFILTAILIIFCYYYFTSVQPSQTQDEQNAGENPPGNVPSNTEDISDTPPAQTPATSKNDEEEVAFPYINSISPSKGEIGTVVILKGRNLAGYSGDLDAWIESSEGKVGYLPAYGETVYPKTDTITVQIPETVCTLNNTYSGKPCTSTFEILPGEYKIFTRPWGNESNKVPFTVTAKWVTKTNEIIGISFMVPENFEIEFDAEDEEIIEIRDEPFGPNRFRIRKLNQEEYTKRAEEEDKIADGYPEYVAKGEVIVRKEVAINGVIWEMSKVHEPVQFYSTRYVTKTKNNEYLEVTIRPGILIPEDDAQSFIKTIQFLD